MRATAKPLSSSPMRVETANTVETADLFDAASSLSPKLSLTSSSFDNPPKKPNTSHQDTKLVRHTRKSSRRRYNGENHSSRRREWKNASENPSNGEVTADGAVGWSSSGFSEGELPISTKFIKNAFRIRHNNRNNNNKGSKNIRSPPRHRQRHRHHFSLTEPISSTCHLHPSSNNPTHLFPFSSTSSSSVPSVSATSSTSVLSTTLPENFFSRPCLPKETPSEVPPVTRVVHRTVQTRVPRTLSANVQTSKCRLTPEAVQTDFFVPSPHASSSQNADKLPTAVVLTSTTGAQTSPSSLPSELAHHHNVVAEGLEKIAVFLGQAPQEKESTKTFPLVLPALGEANSQEKLQFWKVQRRLEEVVQLAEERHVVRMQMEHRFDEMHSKLRRSEAESEATRQNLLHVHQTEIEMLEQRWNNEHLKLFREQSTREALLQKEKIQLTTTLEATQATLQWQRQQAIQTRECQFMQHEEQLQHLLCTYTLQVRNIEEERNALLERLQTQLKLTSEIEAQNKCLQLSLGSERLSCQQAIGQLRSLTEELDLVKYFANSTSEKAAMFESALQREETNHQAIRIATSQFVHAHRKHVSQLQETLQKAVARFVDLKAQYAAATLQQQQLQIPFHHCPCSLDHCQVQHSLRRHHDHHQQQQHHEHQHHRDRHQQHKGNDDLHQSRTVLLPAKKLQQREEEEREKVQRPKKACEKSPRDLPIIHHSETSSSKKVNSNKQCSPTGRSHKTHNDNDNNKQTTINDDENTSDNVNIFQPSSSVCDGIFSQSQSRFTKVSCLTCREEKTEDKLQSREKAKQECFHSKANNGFSSQPFSTLRMPALSTATTTSHAHTKNNESNTHTKSSTATAPPPKKNDTKKKALSSSCSSQDISVDSSASNNINGYSCNHANNSNEKNLMTSITATTKAMKAPGVILGFCAAVSSRIAAEKKLLGNNSNNYDYDDVFASIGVTDVSDIFRDINVECSSL